MKQYFLFSLFGILASFSFAQDAPLFSTSKVEGLTTEQQKNYEKILKSKYVKKTWLAQFSPLSTRQKEGKIKFDIPESDCNKTASFYGKHIDYQSDTQFEWYGELVGCDTCEFCFDGEITLIAEPNKIYGHLIIDDQVYEFYNIGGGKTVLAELNFSTDIPFQECVTHGKGHADPNIGKEPKGNNGNGNGGQPKDLGACNVRLLVLYNQSAADNNCDIDALANLAISQLKITLLNSAIPSGLLNIVHVGTQPINFMATPLTLVNMGDDLNNFALNQDVLQAKQAAYADLVVLLTGDSYTTQETALNGTIQQKDAWGISTPVAPLMPQHAFSIVQARGQTTGRYTFTHEVGHLFGAGHWDDDARPGPSHGHFFVTGGFWGTKNRNTMMIRLEKNSDKRLLYFSNPNILYKNVPTGTTAAQAIGGRYDYNALQISGAACQVADYVTIVEDLYQVVISGQSFICVDGSACLLSQPVGGHPPYTYEWRTSLDGINYGAVKSPNQNYCVNTGLPSVGSRIWAKVTITDSQGNITYRTHSLLVTNTGQGGVSCQH